MVLGQAALSLLLSFCLQTAAEREVSWELDQFSKLPVSVLSDDIVDVAWHIDKLRNGPEKVRLATRLVQKADDYGTDSDALQTAVDSLVRALSQTPEIDKDDRAKAEQLLAEADRLYEVDVNLDTSGFRDEIAKIDARTKLRQVADFTLKDIQGQTWTLSKLKGKVVLVNFWGLYCGPCLREMPLFDSAYQKFKDRGLVVLGIGVDEVGLMRDYASKSKVSFPLLPGLNDGMLQTFAMGGVGIPVSVVYDRSGKLVAEAEGAWTGPWLAKVLSRAGLTE